MWVSDRSLRVGRGRRLFREEEKLVVGKRSSDKDMLYVITTNRLED